MKASTLIDELRSAVHRYGDLEVDCAYCVSSGAMSGDYGQTKLYRVGYEINNQEIKCILLNGDNK